MKNIYLILFLIPFSVVYGQQITYQPIHGTVTLWLMNYGNVGGMGGQANESQARTIWSGDTTINGQTYTRIFKGPLDPNGPMIYNGGIREDIPNQQRYYIDPTGIETNITISQFLEIGDTLIYTPEVRLAFLANSHQDYLPQVDTLYVNNIGTSLENNGNYSVTYTFSSSSGQLSEFITYNAVRGFDSHNGFENWSSTYCYRVDGAQTPVGFETPWSYSCDANLSEEAITQISVSPNPSNGYFEIISNKLISHIEIMDLQGRIITHYSPNNNFYPFLLEENGQFICKLSFEDGTYHTEKIVKQ